MAFSSSLAGFLGQLATQGCCTAYWANISLEVSHEGMESLKRATASRCLGGQSKKGDIALQGAYAWHHTLKMWIENWLPGEDSHPVFSYKSSTISCSFPKSDTRPPFKLFTSLSSLPKNQRQHASSKCPLSPVPPVSSQPNPIACSSQPWLPAVLKRISPHWSSQSLCSLLCGTAALSAKSPSLTAIHPNTHAPYLLSNHLSY